MIMIEILIKMTSSRLIWSCKNEIFDYFFFRGKLIIGFQILKFSRFLGKRLGFFLIIGFQILKLRS